jgi:hypothetical protein
MSSRVLTPVTWIQMNLRMVQRPKTKENKARVTNFPMKVFNPKLRDGLSNRDLNDIRYALRKERRKRRIGKEFWI